MRILVLCSDTGVRVGDGKGAALHLLAVTSAFAALGHQTEVVGVAANPDGPLERWDVPQHLVPHPGRSVGLVRELRKRAVVEEVAARGLEVAARLRPDLVYERLSLFGTAGLRVARPPGHDTSSRSTPCSPARRPAGGACTTPSWLRPPRSWCSPAQTCAWQ